MLTALKRGGLGGLPNHSGHAGLSPAPHIASVAILIHKKELLLRGLAEGGLGFQGPCSDGLEDRATRLVLLQIARGLRADRLHAGMKAGAEVLGAGLYSDRHVRRALALLQKAGVIQRVRSRTAKALKEAPARNYIHPIVIDAAVAWALAWRNSPGSKRPPKREIQTPQLQPCMPAKPVTTQVPEGQADILTGCQADILAEEHTTPPLPPVGGEGELCPASPGHPSPPSGGCAYSHTGIFK